MATRYSFLTSPLFVVITGLILNNTRQDAGLMIKALNRKLFLFCGVLMPAYFLMFYYL